MSRVYPLGFATIALAALHACGGRTLAPPGAEETDAGGQGGAGSSQGGATTVSSTTVGVGGASGVGGGAAGEAGSPPNPVECLTCVAQNCPEAVACVTDPECIQGLVCSVSQCLSGGQPDLMCVAECFDGDVGKAFEAIQALTCIFTSCGDACSGLLPF